MKSVATPTKPGRNGLRARPAVSLISGAILIAALISGCVGGSPTGSARQSNVTHARTQFVGFAACMRSHGAPGFPDPDHDEVFTLPPTIGGQAPAFLRAIHACQSVQPSSLSIDQSS